MTIVHEPKEDASEVQWYRDPVVSTADHQLGKSETPEFASCSLQLQLTWDTGLGPQHSLHDIYWWHRCCWAWPATQ